MLKWLKQLFSRNHKYFFCFSYVDENTGLKHEISLCRCGKKPEEACFKAIEEISLWTKEKGQRLNDNPFFIKSFGRVD